jgi:hypothetical protein
MSIPLKVNDPAAWMLIKGIEDAAAGREGWITPTHDEIYRDDCYICTDPEFALMGLPVCKPCDECGGHVPADDIECENGHVPPEYIEMMKEDGVYEED